MNFTIGRAARQDIESIAEFYVRESRELAARFIEELDRALLLLREHPGVGERVGTRHRRFPLQGFPYFVNYRIDDEKGMIHVVAIAHQRRRPGYWVNRVEELARLKWCQTPI
jgi:plasmid stabilization system protein ParE